MWAISNVLRRRMRPAMYGAVDHERLLSYGYGFTIYTDYDLSTTMPTK
jgi:hypothetical protein